jgi:hypothetical protein
MTVDFGGPFASAIDQACAILLEDPKRAYESNCERRFMVALSIESFGHGRSFAERYETVSSFVDAVKAREPTLVAFGTQLVASFDAARGVALALPLINVDPETELDKYVRSSCARTVEGSPNEVPLALLLELTFDAKRVQPALLDHPELASPEAQRALLDRFAGLSPRAPYYFTGLFTTLVQRLLEVADGPTIDRAVAIWGDPTHPFARVVGNVAITTGIRPILETMIARADAIAADPAAPEYQTEQTRWALARLAAIEPARSAELAEHYGRIVSPQLDREGLVDDPRVAAAARILTSVQQHIQSGAFPKDAGVVVDAAVALLDHPKLALDARRLLSVFDRQVVRTALERAGRLLPKVPARKGRVNVPDRIDFFERYEAGEHEAVWLELGRLGEAVHDPRLAPAALAVARATMARVQTNLEAIVLVLKKSRYALAAGKKAIAPVKDGEKKLAALAKLVKGPLPHSIVAFYERFDGVSLAEDPNALTDDYTLDGDLGRWDPLVVSAIGTATKDLKAQLLERKAILPELQAPLALYLAPTIGAKYDPSDEFPDDAPARVLLAGAGMDGSVVQAERPTLDFVDWLRLHLSNGGFRAIEDGATRAALTAKWVPF